MSDSQNEMAELTPKEMTGLLSFCMQNNKNLMIWGAPGIGKTHLSRAGALEYGGGYLPLHLTLMEPIDLN